MIGDSRNRSDLVSTEFGIFDFHAYFVLKVNLTPDTFHKVHNGEQSMVVPVVGARISPLVCNEGKWTDAMCPK